MPKKKPEPVFTKDSLKVAFERPQPEELGIVLETDRDLYVKQIEAEYSARERIYEKTLEADLKAERNGSESDRGYGAYLLGMNIEKVAKVFKEYNETVKKGSPHICKQVFNYIPDYNAVASICLKTLVDGISNVTPLNSSCLYLARRIEDEINFIRLAQKSKRTANAAAKMVRKKGDTKHKHDSLRWWVTKGAEMEWFAWTEQERMQIGNALIALVCNELKWFKVETRTVKEMGRFKKRNYLIAQPNVIHWIEECRKALALKMRPSYEPMYVPPVDWTPETVTNGGYITAANKPLSMIKTPNKTYLRELRNAAMSDVYDALNSIQRTPIQINTFVLDWLNYFIENQVSWADDLDLPVLCQRKVEDHVRRPDDADTNEEALFWYQKDCTEFYRDEQVQAGKRASFYQMIGLAEKYREEDRFYVPWQGDRRMRVYPASKLNLQGHDYTKALLMFADGVELGKHGLKWLEIHMANLFGVDKCSFKQRRKWVHEHAQEIKLLAADPLASRDFWSQADSPWQALAVAKELSEAWSMDNPKKFVSYIPVALDGSCSGLQILGAALRCEETGQHVNLIPKDAPADIYGVVAGIVEKELREIVGDMDRKEVLKVAEAETHKAWVKAVGHADDADWSFVIERVKGSSSEDDTKVIKDLRKVYFMYTEAWAWLQFGLNRSTVKRNVMTYCYGSEKFGFTEQCLEDIIYPAYKAHRKAIAAGKHSEWYFNGSGNRAAQLLASHVYPAVKRTVLRAAQAMDWMQKTAKLIAKENRPVRWTTPLGFPVLQEYRKFKEAKTQCYFQGARRILSVNIEKQDYDASKAATAVAPNVVHSLDSAHLQTVVNMAREQLGIKHFALVHDSFGTHAGNTEGFFMIIRKALIDLFTEHDVFKDLYEEFKAQIHPDKRDKIPELPEYGNLELGQIAESLYAFA